MKTKKASTPDIPLELAKTLKLKYRVEEKRFKDGNTQFSAMVNDGRFWDIIQSRLSTMDEAKAAIRNHKKTHLVETIYHDVK